ncbi:hypothetical protein [Streptomyces sp. NPDC050982]|uniref:hypothetical protein n=1 Tax=Streptomyces sp. NPDC050982 TaxID=3154746 RepID=UPI0034094F9F
MAATISRKRAENYGTAVQIASAESRRGGAPVQKTVVVNDPQANKHSQIVVTVGIGF